MVCHSYSPWLLYITSKHRSKLFIRFKYIPNISHAIEKLLDKHFRADLSSFSKKSWPLYKFNRNSLQSMEWFCKGNNLWHKRLTSSWWKRRKRKKHASWIEFVWGSFCFYNCTLYLMWANISSVLIEYQFLFLVKEAVEEVFKMNASSSIFLIC